VLNEAAYKYLAALSSQARLRSKDFKRRVNTLADHE